MQKANRILLLVNLFLLFALLAVACSKSNPVTGSQPVNPGPSPTQAARPYGSSPIPNDHTFAFAPQQQASNWSLIPNVYAQTQTPAVMTGNYSGFCSNDVQNTLSATSGWAIVYGLGSTKPYSSNGSPVCGQEWSNGAATAAGTSDSPAPVIGSGTVEGLVVLDSTASTVAAGDGVFQAWIENNSGAWSSTPITCTLGTQNRCEDTTDTASVADGNGLAVVFSLQPGSTISGLQVFIGKQ